MGAGRGTAVLIIGVIGLLGIVNGQRSASPGAIREDLSVPPGPARIVFFQPADCVSHRELILRQIREEGAIPVVLYADHMSDDELPGLLGEATSEITIRRMTLAGFERMIRKQGITGTPFVVSFASEDESMVVDSQLGP